MSTTPIITKDQLLKHWLGHRDLTRRVIEKFPEREFFEFSVGGMRPMSELTAELMAVGPAGIKAIATNDTTAPFEHAAFKTKAEYLEQWDKDTETINRYWPEVGEERFPEMFNLFGQYNFPILWNIMYFIDNEIHHRGQGFVYLRALGIEPPFFWDRP
ncbi:DinB family protein [Flavobacterium sp. J372]|uniref:DinB family protein n=1 Tax=Flavobacterium sp. J372 TaxID=2898436 RepID=UPI0021517AF3|nr:DinB family protein [Flavobacterium sp. J372]MCR5861272.1 DinB family protein [Flavobacterium sp. J372]